MKINKDRLSFTINNDLELKEVVTVVSSLLENENDLFNEYSHYDVYDHDTIQDLKRFKVMMYDNNNEVMADMVVDNVDDVLDVYPAT